MVRRVWLAWSGGKDSAWALEVLRGDGRFEVAGLFTTLDEASGRGTVHGVRRGLLARQAACVGLPIVFAGVPRGCSDERYGEIMRGAIGQAVSDGVACMGFGDLFLEEVRRYREEKLAGTGLEAVFPLWGVPTGELARAMIAGGLKARVVCVDTRRLDGGLAGRMYDESFLGELPEGVDACGENGEFHCFAFDGPMFGAAVAVEEVGRYEQDGLAVADFGLGGEK